MDKLAEAISFLKNMKEIEWGGGKQTGEKTKEGRDIITMPYPIYPDILWDSLQLLGTDNKYLDHMEKVLKKDISKLSLTELRTLLTSRIRGERFVDGLIADFVERGEMLQVLERIKEIADKNKPRYLTEEEMDKLPIPEGL